MAPSPESTVAAQQLTAAERAATVASVWAEARYNFAYWDRVRADWDSGLVANLKLAAEPQSDLLFYRRLRRLVALLGDGRAAVIAPPRPGGRPRRPQRPRQPGAKRPRAAGPAGVRHGVAPGWHRRRADRLPGGRRSGAPVRPRVSRLHPRAGTGVGPAPRHGRQDRIRLPDSRPPHRPPVLRRALKNTTVSGRVPSVT